MVGGADSSRDRFSAANFYVALASSIDEQIDIQIESFKKELLTVAKKAGNEIINDENLGECCDKLRKRIKSAYSENFRKFSMYADRNIFVIAQQPAPPVPLLPEKSSYETAIEVVESLRDSYRSKQDEIIQLKSECGNGDLLLKDMRKTLFTIRVGAQMLDECNLQPINETVRTLDGHRRTITELSSQARDLKKEMSQFCEVEVIESGRTAFATEDEVMTGNLDDIRLMNQNIHG